MSELSDEIVVWQIEHGRHDLPWQVNRTPYSVWVSEIMLQQTQVITAINYFNNFIDVFPNVLSLARATEDDVLKQWSGLGYYSRARNLLKAARLIVNFHSGAIPSDYQALMNLPGIGRSTAGAILSLAYKKKYPILDGNVKRVLARVFRISGPTNAAPVMRTLWLTAEQLLPDQNVHIYTQGLMDLGATVCSRRNPNCAICPLSRRCRALLDGVIEKYPAPNKKRASVKKTIYMVIFFRNQKILLKKGSGKGLWPGLWGFFDSHELPEDALHQTLRELNLRMESVSFLESFRHQLSHINYLVQPVKVHVSPPSAQAESSGIKWINLTDFSQLPISVPVRKIIDSLR